VVSTSACFAPYRERVSRTTLHTTLRTLREPRYAALSVLMAVVALVCVAAGTWQIVRFDDKVRENDALTANARDPVTPVHRVLPLVGAGTAGTDAVEFRRVTATGHYDGAHQALVRLRSVGGNQGYYVLTPLITDGGTLLVVRGFVAAPPNGQAVRAPSPPQHRVSIVGRAQTSETKKDLPSGIPSGQLASINATDQAGRLGGAVYDGYVELVQGQPGTKGLTALPAPDLSNPAGGAVEPQHFAYILQWYLFAVLALAAPFAMARAERRERNADRDPDSGDGAVIEHSRTGAPPALSESERRAAKLADRYGRPVG
jgi:cytochrome oxidase assembly protein ShyY1